MNAYFKPNTIKSYLLCLFKLESFNDSHVLPDNKKLKMVTPHFLSFKKSRPDITKPSKF